MVPGPIHAGGANAAFRSSDAASNGLYGAIQGANSAPPTQISVSAAATTVTGDLRKLYARSWFQNAWKFTELKRRFLPLLQGQGFLDQRREVAGAERDDLVVEVVARVVQEAVVRPAALAEEYVGARAAPAA